MRRPALANPWPGQLALSLPLLPGILGFLPGPTVYPHCQTHLIGARKNMVTKGRRGFKIRITAKAFLHSGQITLLLYGHFYPSGNALQEKIKYC